MNASFAAYIIPKGQRAPLHAGRTRCVTVWFVALALLTVFTGYAPCAMPSRVQDADADPFAAAHVPGQLLVTLRDGTGNSPIRSLNARETLVRDPLTGSYMLATAAADEREAYARLLTDPRVSSVGPNYRYHAAGTPNDPIYPEQTWTHAVNLEAAWEITTGAPTATIAVLDTGVDAAHPDLAGRVLPGYDATSGGSDTSDRAPNRHGTTVALIAAGRGNDGTGGAGVAWGARVLPVRCLDADGNGTTSSVADGVRWATEHGATAINLSVTATNAPFAPLLSQQLAYAHTRGIPVIVAAGEGRDAVTYPANDATVITVGATDASGAIADFSPRRIKVDVLAPGVSVAVASVTQRPGEITAATGTSFSSAIVAGTVALMQSVRADLRPEDAVTILMQTTRPLMDNRAGLLDAGKAVAAVKALPMPLPPLTVPAYRATYDRVDAPVATGATTRGYIWGPQVRANLFEPYAESAGGQRPVWYFDKGRLEQNDPASGDVTSGLLVTEMVTGRVQTGRNQFAPRDPATVPVAGDPTAARFVSYATLNAVRQLPPRLPDTLITETLMPNGQSHYGTRHGGVPRDRHHPRSGNKPCRRFRVRGLPQQYGSRRGKRWLGRIERADERAVVRSAVLRRRATDHRGILDDGDRGRATKNGARAGIRAARPHLYTGQPPGIPGRDGQRRPALPRMAVRVEAHHASGISTRKPSYARRTWGGKLPSSAWTTLIGEMREQGAARADIRDHREGFGDAEMDGVRLRPQTIEHEQIQPPEQVARGGGHDLRIGHVGKCAETEAENLGAPMRHEHGGDGVPVDSKRPGDRVQAQLRLAPEKWQWRLIEDVGEARMQ